jgi:hypothetical protein
LAKRQITTTSTNEPISRRLASPPAALTDDVAD